MANRKDDIKRLSCDLSFLPRIKYGINSSRNPVFSAFLGIAMFLWIPAFAGMMRVRNVLDSI